MNTQRHKNSFQRIAALSLMAGLWLFVLGVRAESLSARTSTKAASPWAYDLNATYSQELVTQSDDKQSRSVVANFGTLYKTSTSQGLSSLRGDLALMKDLKDSESREQGISDLLISARWLLPGGWENFRHFLQTDGLLPLSEKSQVSEGLKMGMGLGYALKSSGKRWLPGFRLGMGLKFIKYIHQYETSTSGEVLTSYRLGESLALGYRVKNWELSIDGEHRHQFNYESRVTELIKHTEQISWNFNSQWSLEIGHTNMGPWLKEDGQSTNFSIVNDDNSSFFLGMTGRFE